MIERTVISTVLLLGALVAGGCRDGAPTAPAPIPVTVLSPGKGDEVKSPCVAELLIESWQDGYAGSQTWGQGKLKFPLVIDGKERRLPGWRAMVQGAREGAVLRAVMSPNRLFGVPYNPAYATSGVFFQVTVLKIHPTEATKVSTVKAGGGERKVETYDWLKVHYTARTGGFEGKTFDSSRARKTPYEVKVAPGEGVAAWHPTLLGMKKGEVRRVKVPFYLAVGHPIGDAPPHQSVYFEVELLDFLDGPRPKNKPQST